ncbi:MAG TPA: hypothetical protein VFZ58_03395 [Candidatus Saccharimonadales bacterium]
MGPENNPAQPQASAKPKRGEFLALRLIGAVGSTVLLTIVAAGAISTFVELLSKSQGTMLDAFLMGFMHDASVLSATMLLTLAVVPWLLFRSVKTSLASEPRFTGRTVYKVTMYLGLMVLVLATVLQLIGALAAVISSLLSIGVSGVDIGGIYLHKFLPSLLGAVVTGFVAFCFLQTDRGRDKVSLMSLVVAIVSVVFAVALLIATAISLHSDKSTNPLETPGGSSLNSGDSKKNSSSPSYDYDTPSSSELEDYPY